MEFRSANDLLVWLVSVEDSEHASRLTSGKDLYDFALAEGKVEWSESDFAGFNRLFFALRDDGAVTFRDYRVQSSGRPLGDIFSNPYMDVAERDIRVTSQGRIAAQGSSRPSVTIGQFALGNISNVDLTVLLSAVEQQVEASDADEKVKEEARGKLHALRDLAEKTGTGAGGELIGSALATALRQLGVF
jgi:hypothetical protein